MNYYVIDAYPTKEGKNIETGHWALDMIKRCDTYDDAWAFCKSYAEDMVKDNPDRFTKVYSEHGFLTIDVLETGWSEYENERVDFLKASLCVFESNHFFAGGRML